jgi:hypothetical protein
VIFSITSEVKEKVARSNGQGAYKRGDGTSFDWVTKRNRRIKGETLDDLVDNARDYATLRWNNSSEEVEAVRMDGYTIIGSAKVQVTVLHPEQ